MQAPGTSATPSPRASQTHRRASQTPWSRYDLLWLGVCAVLALSVRLPGLGDVGLTHYDEGGYAMSAQAVARGDDALFYPHRHLLSPPVVYTLQGLALRVFGERDTTLIGLAVAIGVLAVIVVYTLTRLWFGRAVAVSVSLLVALSDFHIAYSRVGLTDMLFLTLFCASLCAYTLAEQRRDFRFSILAGLLTGLTWNTKYHGWLAGVVAGAALLPRLLPQRTASGNSSTQARPGFGEGFQRILVAAAVATAMYVPWFLHIQSLEGGYAAFAEYQSEYLQPARALRNLLAQLRYQRYIDGPLSHLAPALALMALGWLVAHLRLALVFWAAALYLGASLLGLSAVALALAGLGAWYLLRERRDHAAFMALAFAAAFACLSPLYKAYARLLLPLVTACYVLAGVGLERIARGELPWLSSRATPSWKEWATGAVTAALLLVANVVRDERPGGQTYRSSSGFRKATATLVSHLPRDTPVVVVGEPLVVFYLRAHGYTAWHSNGPDDFDNVAPPGRSYTLVAGRYARGAVERYAKAHPGQLGPPLADVPVASTSDVRLLDDMSPSVAATWQPTGRVRYDLVAFPFQPAEQASDGSPAAAPAPD